MVWVYDTCVFMPGEKRLISGTALITCTGFFFLTCFLLVDLEFTDGM